MRQMVQLDEAGRARILAAVHEAERGTDGEIVTVIARASDRYQDVALHYAAAAMLLTVALAAINPSGLEDKIAWFSNGWDVAPDPRRALFALFLIETVIFLIVRYALAWTPLRIALAPRSTRSRRVRRRAIEAFRIGTDRRTEARVGILLYLSLDERMAEIVADEAIHGKVAAETWGEAMTALIDPLREGRAADGMAAAVERIGAVLAEHFPKTDADTNELPDRLIEL